MGVSSLGYVGVGATDSAAWQPFATDFLGMEPVETGGGATAYRADSLGRRLIILPEKHDGGLFYGWEVPDAGAFDEMAATLENADVPVQRATDAERALRGVADMVHCLDPAGHRVELFYGMDPAGGAFLPARTIKGFRTGELGLGHMLIYTEDARSCAAFYRNILGFRLSDWRAYPNDAIFLHCNPRHHSLAIVGPKPARLHHVMIELNSFDDVGDAYDKALTMPGRVALTLGRHANDRMVSFYVNTPSGFLLEYGWGGRLVDDDTWEVEETPPCSLWGHVPCSAGTIARADAPPSAFAAQGRVG